MDENDDDPATTSINGYEHGMDNDEKDDDDQETTTDIDLDYGTIKGEKVDDELETAPTDEPYVWEAIGELRRWVYGLAGVLVVVTVGTTFTLVRLWTRYRVLHRRRYVIFLFYHFFPKTYDIQLFIKCHK